MSQTEVQLIKDAVIVNADVSNSAAIDVSKISGAMPLAGGSFTDDVTFTGASANIVFDKSDNALEFNDDAKATFGSGADTTFTHSGADFAITNTTGNLNILNNSADAVQIRHGSETMIKAISDGAVELYNDDSKKFQTTSTGVDILGSDTTGSNLNGDLVINNAAGTRYAVFDASHTKLNFSDNASITVGDSNDLKIFHDGSNSKLTHDGSGGLYIGANTFALQKADHSENYISMAADGAVELYHDGTKKIETTSSGISVTGQADVDSINCTGELDLVGNLDLNSDSHKIKLGAGDDFQFYHDGSNNYIFTNNGDIIMQTSGDDIQLLAQDDIILKVQGGVETAINCVGDGAVELYHNNSKKLETLSDGVNVTGTLKVNNSAFTGGKILQVLTATTTNSASTSSSSFVDTNVTANITPSASSSKILVMIDAPFHVIRNPGTTNSFQIKVFRDSTEITDAITTEGSYLSGIGSGSVSSNRLVGCVNKIILDSPSSTSQLTYKMQMGGAFNTNTVTFQDSCQSQITLMEVAG